MKPVNLPQIFNKKVITETLNIVVINIVLLGAFLELGSLGLFWLKNKQFFYSRPIAKSYKELGIDMEGVRLGNSADSVIERFHPFFGYIQRPGPDFQPGFKINNYGFLSPYDYPFIKSKNQVIVAIFGGSVASNLSVFEVQNKVITNKLKELPQFKDKEFIILSFATGGYKQPQQLMILNYFLALGQKFDIIINVDGFNEVALSSLNNRNNLDTTMPSFQHISPLVNLASHSLTPRAIETMSKIRANKEKLNEEILMLFTCKLASCHTIKSIYVQSLINNYRQDVLKFDRDITTNTKGQSIVQLNTVSEPLADAVVFDKIAQHWVRSSVLMKRVSEASKIPYFHFLQPNQYYQTKRVFSEAEKKVAFNKETPYANAVKLGYPKLLENVKKLQSNGVQFFSAINILDDIKEPIYIDSCCHYNDLGLKALGNYVGDSLVKALSQNTEKTGQK